MTDSEKQKQVRQAILQWAYRWVNNKDDLPPDLRKQHDFVKNYKKYTEYTHISSLSLRTVKSAVKIVKIAMQHKVPLETLLTLSQTHRLKTLEQELPHKFVAPNISNKKEKP